MNRRVQTVMMLALVSGFLRIGLAETPTTEAERTETLRLGAVAYAPSSVTIFKDLSRYLTTNGLPADFILYSNYDALVEALEREEVDIAWNTPLAHAQYHVKNQCSSRTLVMRDVDFNVRSTLVVRADSGIKSIEDLPDKRLVLGSSQSAESTVLPLHFLKLQGVEFSNVLVVSLDGEVDSKGNPCASPQHVLQALHDGRGEAGIITAGLWNRVRLQPSVNGEFHQIWTSPPFSHCVFSASAELDENLASRFTQLMTSMDHDDPMCANLMKLEGTKKWLPGSPDGFKNLVDVLLAESR